MDTNSNKFTQNTIINDDSPLTEATHGQILTVCRQSREIENDKAVVQGEISKTTTAQNTTKYDTTWNRWLTNETFKLQN